MAILLLAACGRPPQYPQQLVEADSAMRWGRYDQADSLLKAYRLTTEPSKNNEVRRYLQLLTLESKFFRGNSSLDDLLLADSLRMFYESSSKEKHAKALAILGDIYFASYDYPSALEFLLKAEEEAELAKELWVQGIICKKEGDIYLYQQMLDNMESFYRRSYNLAEVTLDTLRLTHAMIRMGRIATYKQKADSATYYYKKAIEIGNSNSQANPTVRWAKELLADIYLQTEQFDKASSIMSRDTMNDVNWGYWHYQQNHTDSAIYYFRKSLGRQSMEGKVELLRLLTELEEKRGNTTLSFAYAKKTTETEDSIKELSQTAATLQTEAQHRLNNIKEQLRVSESRKLFLWIIIASILAISFITTFFVRRRWTQKKADKEAALAYERLMRQEEERKHQLSEEKIEENNREIARLNDELKKAQQMNDTLLATRLKLDSEELKNENETIKASLNRRAYLMEKLENSLLYNRIKIYAGKEKFHLTDEEWQALATDIDNAYDNFTGRLLALGKLDDVEMKVCYLIKLEVPPSSIATMLYQSRGAITMKRRRMHEKLLHLEKGDSKKFDEFILNF
ncbi:MAG: hypothetical protein IJK43_10200 [Prevotella sp.]|nr:hypothetical protein [Prevotella sp.]